MGFLPTLQVERLGFSTSTAADRHGRGDDVNVGGNLAAGWLLQRGLPRVAVIVGAAISMAFCAAGIFIDGVPDLCAPGAGRRLLGRDRRRARCAVHRPSRALTAAASWSARRPAC